MGATCFFPRGVALILFFSLGAPAFGSRGPTPVPSPGAKRMTVVLQEFEAFYQPITSGLGFKLTVQIDNNSSSESADANRDARHANVTVTRRLLENARMSEDGLRTILCHEMGHVLGGAPRRNIPPEWDGPIAPDGFSFMSSEGQADYYSTLVCFRRLVRGQNHQKRLAQEMAAALPPVADVAHRCDTAHGIRTVDSLICQRAVAGAFNMLQMIKEFPISVASASPFVATSTILDLYPDRQCRLDTFIAGALCRTESVPDTAALDFNDGTVNTCADRAAARPACWYSRSSPENDL